jgi:anthranilate synthase component II
MKILLIDNYDSFTYNLVHYFLEFDGVELVVVKNDMVDDLLLNEADKIVISPGPGTPSQLPNVLQVIKGFSGIKPIFGICLGLQSIYEAFGGTLLNPARVYHGVTSTVAITDQEDQILKGIPNPFKAGRYHSWVCDENTLPPDLIISSWDEDREIMSCRHRSHQTFGVQFHPESFLTPEGKKMIENFIRL